MNPTQSTWNDQSDSERRSQARKVFISHAEEDFEIAEALQNLIRDLSGGTMSIQFSSSNQHGVGIPGGREWFDWIKVTINECGNVVVLLTPTSFDRPWLHFESGLASANDGVKVVGLRIGISGKEARPGAFKLLQTIDGDLAGLEKLWRELAERSGCNPRDAQIQDRCSEFHRIAGESLKDRTGTQDEQDLVQAAVFEILEDTKELRDRHESQKDTDALRAFGLDSMFRIALTDRWLLMDPYARLSVLEGLAQEAGFAFVVPLLRHVARNPITGRAFKDLVGDLPVEDGEMPFAAHEFLDAICECIDQIFELQNRAVAQRWQGIPAEGDGNE